jgi:hypothetical protein
MLEINERTRCSLTLTFTDESGSLVIPASLNYRVDNPATSAEIQASQIVVPSAATHQLVISATLNRCSGTTDELRRVTVEATGLVAGQVIYKILKLKGAA